jgi:5'-deoxynucleotidase YfbR-like HD superfamily hydrolase
MPHIETGILGRDRVELARAIAYHDVCEVIIGDIPQYTRLNRSKRNRAHVQAEIRLSELPDGERIYCDVPPRQRKIFDDDCIRDLEQSKPYPGLLVLLR